MIKKVQAVSRDWCAYVINHNQDPTFCGFVSDSVEKMLSDINEMAEHYFLYTLDKQGELIGITLIERWREDQRWMAEVWGPFGDDLTVRQQLVNYLVQTEPAHLSFFGTNLSQYFDESSTIKRSVQVSSHRRLTAEVHQLSQLTENIAQGFKLQTYQLEVDDPLIPTVKDGCFKLFDNNFTGGQAAFETVLSDFDQSTLIVCFDGNQIVGFNQYARDADNLFLNYIIVDERHRHQGIARTLIKTMCLQNPGQKMVHLNWPLKKTAAGKFYKELNFKVERILDNVSVEPIEEA